MKLPLSGNINSLNNSNKSLTDSITNEHRKFNKWSRAVSLFNARSRRFRKYHRWLVSSHLWSWYCLVLTGNASSVPTLIAMRPRSTWHTSRALGSTYFLAKTACTLISGNLWSHWIPPLSSELPHTARSPPATQHLSVHRTFGG